MVASAQLKVKALQISVPGNGAGRRSEGQRSPASAAPVPTTGQFLRLIVLSYPTQAIPSLKAIGRNGRKFSEHDTHCRPLFATQRQIVGCTQHAEHGGL